MGSPLACYRMAAVAVAVAASVGFVHQLDEPVPPSFAQPATSTAPPGTGTPVSTPAPGIAEFEGRFARGFEVSSFVPGDVGCPGYGAGWWLGPGGDFMDHFEEVARTARWSEARCHSFGYDEPLTVRVRFVGELSPPGSYGHVGAYTRAVRVIEVLSMDRGESCGMSRPDLRMAGLEAVAAESPTTCDPYAGSGFARLCVENAGLSAAGSFDVALDGAVVARGPALDPGATWCSEPLPLPDSDFVKIDIDVGDEVDEYSEDDNCLRAVLEDLDRVPACPPGPLFVPWAGR